MKTLGERMREDVRLGILRLLAAASGLGVRVDLLRTALSDTGRNPSAVALEDDLSWLAERELIAVEECVDGSVARVTVHGRDVAEGRAAVLGVRKR